MHYIFVVLVSEQNVLSFHRRQYHHHRNQILFYWHYNSLKKDSSLLSLKLIFYNEALISHVVFYKIYKNQLRIFSVHIEYIKYKYTHHYDQIFKTKIIFVFCIYNYEKQIENRTV